MPRTTGSASSPAPSRSPPRTSPTARGSSPWPRASPPRLLDGRTEKTHAAWYSLDLPPGDYKLSASFALPTGRASNLAGYVDLFDEDGVETRSGLIFDSLVDVEFRKSVKLTVAAGTRPMLRVRAGSMREDATVSVTKWAGDYAAQSTGHPVN